MTTGIQGGGGATVKIALRFGQAPKNYDSSYSQYTNTHTTAQPNNNPIRSIKEMTDSDRIVPLDTGQNATFDLFNIKSESGLAGGDDWLYVNAYSGVSRIYSHEVAFMVDRNATIQWCQHQPPDTGSLRVFIEPQGARDAGAQWRRTGTTTWRNNDYIETGLNPGNYTVEFKDVAGWDKPANIDTTIESNKTNELTGTYRQHAGSLQVFIDPKVARDEGGWKITWEEEGVWHEHDYVLEFIAPGEHNIEFKAVSGWDKPADMTVIVEDTKTASATGEYVPIVLPGVLMLLLLDDPSSTYSVTYDGNDNTGGNAPVDVNNYPAGDQVTVQGPGDLVRDGYTFTNWNTEADGNGTHYNPDETFIINADVTLFAQWEQITG